MGALPPRDQRVLVIGLSPVKNEEVVSSLRDLGVDAVGCTKPDTAAEQYDAREFEVIAFGRAALGPTADRLKHAFAQQEPSIRFVDAFGPIAVSQVSAAVQRHPGSPALVDGLTLSAADDGGQIQATVLAPCHLTVTLYDKPIDGSLEEYVLHDASVAAGPVSYPITDTQLSEAYSLAVVANHSEFHHLPFL